MFFAVYLTRMHNIDNLHRESERAREESRRLREESDRLIAHLRELRAEAMVRRAYVKRLGRAIRGDREG
jgi:hypothetical protein